MIIILLPFFLIVNAETIGTLYLIEDNLHYTGSRCLDGSQPGYYLSKGHSDGIKKWHIHHMGGGWCWDLKDCYERSKTSLGSTNIWWPKSEYDISGWGGYLSRDYKINPLMWNWNHVFLIYCDGGSFSGNNMTKTFYNGTELFFRGFRNLMNFKLDLDRKHLFYQATDVVISGSSAGGLATYIHLDWWRSEIKDNGYRTGSKVIGLPDSGFFIDYNSLYSTKMRWVFDQMNIKEGLKSVLNDKCIKSQEVESNCIFPEYIIPHIKTPFFAIQSIFDSWQIPFEGYKKDSIKEFNDYGLMFKERFMSAVIYENRNGMFLDSCYHHGGKWNEIIINNTNVGIAFQRFYNNDQYKKEYIQNESYPCEKCCSIL
jgi:hypothetical protein